MIRNYSIFIISFLSLLSPNSHAESNVAAGKEKSQVCAACHGPNGRGNTAALYPALGGQYAAYTQAQLKAFREGARTNDNNSVMRTIVKRITDDEIKAVSEYIQGLH